MKKDKGKKIENSVNMTKRDASTGVATAVGEITTMTAEITMTAAMAITDTTSRTVDPTTTQENMENQARHVADHSSQKLAENEMTFAIDSLNVRNSNKKENMNERTEGRGNARHLLSGGIGEAIAMIEIEETEMGIIGEVLGAIEIKIRVGEEMKVLVRI